MRYFIASFVDPGDRAAFIAARDALAGVIGPDVRWVRPARYHVTLEFIGGIDGGGPTLSEIGSRARRFDDAFPVECRATEVTGFPSADRARVVVVRIDSDGALERIANAPEGQMHVTLGYARRRRLRVPALTVGQSIRLANAALYLSADGHYRKVG